MFIKLLSILISNAIAVYGIFFLNWNFFMILYAYWFSELFSTLAEKISINLLKRKGLLSSTDLSTQSDGRFFFLGIYWVFIVVIAGFITAPSSSYGETLRVLVFRNTSFNLNLLSIIVGVMYLQLSLITNATRADALELVEKYKRMNKRTLVMHVSIIFGTFSWFAMNTDKFFFKIDAGEYGVYGFMLVFIFIRVIGDLWELKNSKQK